MMPQVSGNLFDAADGAAGSEDFLTLFRNSGARIERIVSRSHGSPADHWYDQEEDEWVMVVRGAAALEFDGGAVLEMKEGDYMLIPRHVRHRVVRTAEHTIWLAVHMK